MSNLIAQATSLTSRIPGRAYLLLAILIFASANSITRKLTELGAQNLIDGRNPISFCNVLFVGNLCALITLILIYGKQLNVQSLKQLSWTDWLGLSGVAILSGSPVAGILAAYLILGEAPTMAQYIGGSVIICGIVLNQIGVSRMPATIPSTPQVSAAKEMDVEVGFKGI